MYWWYIFSLKQKYNNCIGRILITSWPLDMQTFCTSRRCNEHGCVKLYKRNNHLINNEWGGQEGAYTAGFRVKTSLRILRIRNSFGRDNNRSSRRDSTISAVEKWRRLNFVAGERRRGECEAILEVLWGGWWHSYPPDDSHTCHCSLLAEMLLQSAKQSERERERDSG